MSYRLPTATWRGLLCRAALLQARAERLGAFSALVRSGSTVVRSVLDGLHLSATRAGQAASDGAAITAAEQDWQAKLREALQTPDLTVAETDLLRDLTSRPATRATVDPFDALYQGVAKHAAELYGSAWPGTPVLSVVPLISHPRQSPDPYALSAQTERTPSGLVVELLVQPDGLGPATFLTIPMVLTHECVCHVVDLAAGAPVDNESPFAEGLMDWASGYHLRRWLPLLCPGMAAAADVHHTLFSAAAVPVGHRHYSPRLIGWTAASELVSQLIGIEKLGRSAAETLVASLAIRMNLSRGSSEERDVVVQRIEIKRLTIADPTLRRVMLDEADVDELF
jgi:hypothetical protein